MKFAYKVLIGVLATITLVTANWPHIERAALDIPKVCNKVAQSSGMPSLYSK